MTHINPASLLNLAHAGVPPHSVEAEQAVLGLILAGEHPEVVPDIMAALKSQDFYREIHQLIYETMETLVIDHGEQPDVVRVGEYARDSGMLDHLGGLSYLTDLARSIFVLTDQVPYLIKVLKNYSTLRQVQKTCHHHAFMASMPGTQFADGREWFHSPIPLDAGSELLNSLIKETLRISNQQFRKSQIAPVGVTAKGELEKIKHNRRAGIHMQGIDTGWGNVNTSTLGWAKPDLIIVGARPSMGKTAFLLNTMVHAAYKKHTPSLLFSLEMSKEQLTQRIMAMLTRTDLTQIRTGNITQEQENRLCDVAAWLEKAPLIIDDTPGLTPQKMRAIISQVMLQTKGELGLIGLDYLQLMHADNPSRDSNRQQDVTAISQSLKGFCKEFELPIVSLAQLSRAVESRQDKRPQLSDLRESGAIEQDADIVMFLYRDHYYNKESHETEAEFIIAKQRNGPVDTLKMHWEGRFGIFTG